MLYRIEHCFNEKMKVLEEETRNNYNKFLIVRTYKTCRNYKTVRHKINEIKKEYWQAYKCDLVRDFYGDQNRM